jgi:hypothetical protein
MDEDEGDDDMPLSLSKYIYAQDDPVDNLDPSGNQDTMEEVGALSISVSVDAITIVSEQGVVEVVQAPAAVSALQTALQWASSIAVLGLVAIQQGDNRSQSVATDDKKVRRHAGVLQVQGKDIKDNPPDQAAVTQAGYTFSGDTLSWGWSQPVPLGGFTALQRLSGFLPLMSTIKLAGVEKLSEMHRSI